MSLYTFIMEYAGGTYVSQVNAPAPESACVKWAQSLDVSEVDGLDLNGKESLVEQMREETPTPLEDLVNVWCKSALVRDELAIINLVRTEQAEDNREGY
jgi:hypothetical protein